jgi:2-C-methyl-D-erythritol 2,4-cyclodiphosphate synthase
VNNRTYCYGRPRTAQAGAGRDQIRGRLAEALGLPVERVNVKATTGEGIGFVGRGQGVAAMAAATATERPSAT